MNAEQTNFAMLGALLAVAVVLLVVVTVGAVVVLRGVGYLGRFRGIQLGRNAKNEMSFGGVIDETPAAPKPSRWAQSFRVASDAPLQTDSAGEPIPAQDLAN